MTAGTLTALQVEQLDARELHEAAVRLADLRSTLTTGPLSRWAAQMLAAISSEATNRGLYRTELLCHLAIDADTYGVAECLCGWVTPVCETNGDAVELLTSHLHTVATT